MEKLGLSISDNLSDIKNAKFFYDKLKAKYNYNNIGSDFQARLAAVKSHM